MLFSVRQSWTDGRLPLQQTTATSLHITATDAVVVDVLAGAAGTAPLEQKRLLFHHELAFVVSQPPPPQPSTLESRQTTDRWRKLCLQKSSMEEIGGDTGGSDLASRRFTVSLTLCLCLFLQQFPLKRADTMTNMPSNNRTIR